MLGLFGISVGGAVADAVRALVDLLVPDFASGWATSLVTSLVAVPDVTGPGFAGVEGLRRDLLGVGFALGLAIPAALAVASSSSPCW